MHTINNLCISIIIVNYKTPQLCIDCINSVFEKTEGIDYEIIVVDNDSQDNSLQILSDYFGDKIKLIDAKANLGFGKANNLGAKYATGEYLFLLNSDTLLINNAIKILYDFISARKEVGIVGGNLYNIDGKPMHSCFAANYTLNNIKVNNFIRAFIKSAFGKISKNEFTYGNEPRLINGYITGADLLIRRSVFEEVGGFDKDFFMYYEENEMTKRVQKAGYSVFSIPAAKIIHLEGASLGKGVSSNRMRMVNRSAVIYCRKVYGEESIVKCYKILISNCNKSRLKRLATLNFDAVKKINQEKNILKQEYKDYLNNH